jgi:hypothetical protein
MAHLAINETQPREEGLNLQPPGSEPGVLPVELSLNRRMKERRMKDEKNDRPIHPSSFILHAFILRT